MLADLDYLVDLPDGTTAIVEIKTTNYNARDKWEYDGKPIVPQYYEAQGRLAAEVLQTVLRKGFAGLDVDFEFSAGISVTA